MVLCLVLYSGKQPLIASMQPRVVLSRAQFGNGALSKIVHFMAERKGVID